MSARDWIEYLWNLLPRPYKVYEAHRGAEAKTEILKYTESLSTELDKAQGEITAIRDKWFPQTTDDELLDVIGWARGKMTRWPKETDDEYRARLCNAFNWYKLGGTVPGIKMILEALGYRDVKVNERITADRWAEFAVVVTLPEGALLVTENIERVERIVNEIKAAHTRLVSTNVQYDPPDIDLDPDHMHRYDHCYYDLGYWPRPNVHWALSEQAITERIRMMMGRERLYRMIITSSPTYDVSIYDGPKSPLAKLYRSRRFVFSTEAFKRFRRWTDAGTWGEHDAWLDSRIYEPRNWAKIERFAFSEAVYDGGEPMDTLNAVYAPAQTKVYETQGVYDDEHYDGDRKPPYDKPILRFKSRSISLGETKLPDAHPSAAAFDVKHYTNSGETSISWSCKRVAKYVQHHTNGVIELVSTSWPCSRAQVISFKPMQMPETTSTPLALDCRRSMQTDGTVAWASEPGTSSGHYAIGDAVLRARWMGTWQDKDWDDADVRFNNSIIKESV